MVPASAPPTPSPAAVFLALLRRDLHVARRELPLVLVRTALQPLMFVVVFGYLLPKMGFVSREYGAALVPGILALSLAFSSVQSVALPMVSEFGVTREIEDRLLAPVPTALVAAEKVVNGVLQGILAVLFVLPVARLIMGPIPGLAPQSALVVLGIVLLGAATFATLGLVLGTAISPPQIGLMFSVIVGPMVFFGCAYYPWAGLHVAPVIQVLVLVNPLVYVSEGMRAALTPGLPHMPLAAVVAALAALSALFWGLGLRFFLRRAVG